MAKLTRKALIELLERGENLYVVCVSSAYIRDARYYEPPFLNPTIMRADQTKAMMTAGLIMSQEIFLER